MYIHIYIYICNNKLATKIWYGGYGPFISIVKTRCPLNASFPSFRIPIYLKPFRSLCKSEGRKKKEKRRKWLRNLSLTSFRDFKCSHKEIAFGEFLPMNSVRSIRWRGEREGERERGDLGNEITRVASNNRENMARMQRRSKFLLQPRTNQFLYGKAIQVSTVTDFCTCNAKLFSRFIITNRLLFFFRDI